MATSITVKVDLKSDSLDRDIEKAFEEGLDEIGKSIVDGAQSTVHVITGQLRDSIQVTERGPGYVVVTATASYAADEEFGNSRRPAHPYMGPQADRMQSEAPRIMQDKINRAL
jgi:HK97 gp10 family phage protein